MPEDAIGSVLLFFFGLPAISFIITVILAMRVFSLKKEIRRLDNTINRLIEIGYQPPPKKPGQPKYAAGCPEDSIHYRPKAEGVEIF